MNEWHEKFHKQQEHWKHHLDHQRELRKKETEKHIDDLLHHSHPPVVACTKKSGLHRLTSRATSASSCGSSAQSSALNVAKPGGGRVRFDSTLTVHTVEQDVLLVEEEEEEVEEVESTCDLASEKQDSEIPQNGEHVESENVNLDPESSQPYSGNPSVDGGDGADSHEREEGSVGLTAEEGEDTSLASVLIEDLDGAVNPPGDAEASPDVAKLASSPEGADNESLHEVGSMLAATAVQGAVQRMTPSPI